MFRWVITHDHHYANDPKFWDEIGVGTKVGYGQRSGTAPEGFESSRAYRFELYDDDGERYFEGVLYVSDDYDIEGDENAVYSPLAWGMADSGCTEVRYPGHPELDCG